MTLELEARFYNENDELCEVTAIVDEGQKGMSRYGLQETPDDDIEAEIIACKLADGGEVELTPTDEENALEAIFEAYLRY